LQRRSWQVRKYLLEEKGRRRLSLAEVRILARAFSGSAQMQPEFGGESAWQEGLAESVEELPLLASGR
jgi:hypothetical protein